MKRLLGLLLVMGIVGCGGDAPKLVIRDGLFYEVNSETPFTGVLVSKHENGQKSADETWKDGKREGLGTMWHANGQKLSEITYKDGKREGRWTIWYENGQKKLEGTYKDDKLVSETQWDEEGNEK